ncbi:MAG: MBL fold metallo-hydrolase [Odoribacter splanchnicus]|nr:MBL fold metallo-hydrolase [Odoribacter splanchnicus]
MEIEIFVNNPWQQNTVVLYDRTGEAVIIDCGCLGDDEEGQLKKFLSEKHLKPVALLDTHLHIDHIFGNNFVKKAFGLEAQAGAADNYLIEHAVEYAAMLGITGITPPPPVGKYLNDGDVVKFGDSELKVIAVPGHSPGSLCFYSEPDRLLIAGDVLFAGSVGRSDLPGGNGRQLIEGIKNKLLCLPDEVRVIPGHGPETTIGEEKKHNPFLR